MCESQRSRVTVSTVSLTKTAALPTGTAFLASPHLGADDVARRDAGASRDRAASLSVGAPGPGSGPVRQRNREAQIGLLESADLVAQPRCLLEFEIGGRLTHALFEIRDYGLQIGPLVVRRFALRQPKGYVIALIDAFEDIGDAATHAFGCDAVCGIVGLLLFA